jgi:hypothetical protein
MKMNYNNSYDDSSETQSVNQDGFEDECGQMMEERGLDWESAVRFVLRSHDPDFLKGYVGPAYYNRVLCPYTHSVSQ